MSIGTITFELDDYTIQLIDDRILIWKGLADHEADIDLDVSDMRNALQTASMLRKD